MHSEQHSGTIFTSILRLALNSHGSLETNIGPLDIPSQSSACAAPDGDRQGLPRCSGSATCLLGFAAGGAMQSIQHFQPDGRSFGADMIGRWRRPRYPSPPRSRGFPVLADERSRHQAPKVRCFGNQGVADRRLAGEPAYHQHVLIWMETKKSGSRSADDRRDLKKLFFYTVFV